MLIIYDINDGHVVSISGFRNSSMVNRELIDKIRLVDPLPENQAELRIYESASIDKIWEAYDKGAILNIALDKDGNPIGVMADGKMII